MLGRSADRSAAASVRGLQPQLRREPAARWVVSVGGVYNGETCVAGSCAVDKDVKIAVAAAPAALAACRTAQSLPRELTRALGVGKRGKTDGWGVVVLRGDRRRL